MYRYREALYRNYYGQHFGRGDASTDELRNRFEEQRIFFRRELRPFLPPDKGAKILDLGCGTGSFLAALTGLGYSNIEGIDLSPSQVKVAHEFGVTQAREGNISEWAIRHQGEYDFISGLDILEHFGKDELMDLLGSIHSALRPGGRVLFRTPNADAPFSQVFAFGDFTHEVFLNKSSAQQLMLATGFRNVGIHPSLMRAPGRLREIFRKCTWFCLSAFWKWQLFASARTWDEVLFTPNIIMVGEK